MYRERRNDEKKDLQRLRQLFKDATRYGGPYYRAAKKGAFELVKALLEYNLIFKHDLDRALVLRLESYRDECGTTYKAALVKYAERDVAASLFSAGFMRLDVAIILRAIRAAAFAYYLDDVDESRRFAQ